MSIFIKNPLVPSTNNLISRRFLFLILIIMSVFFITGCASIARFADDNDERLVYRGVYPATSYDVAIIKAGTGGHPWAGVSVVMWPFAVIDLPFSLVTDTLLSPYDIYMASNNSRYIEFWRSVAQEKTLSMPLPNYLKYYDDIGATVVLRQSRRTNDEDLLKFYFNLAASENNYPNKSLRIIKSIIKKTNQHKHLSSLREDICDTVSSNVSKTKYKGLAREIIRGWNYSSSCIDKFAKAGLKCSTLLVSKNLPEKHIRQCYKQNKTAARLFAKNPATPEDIYAEIFNDEYNKLITKFGSLNKGPNGFDFITMDYITRYTRSRDLIDKIRKLNSLHLTDELRNNGLLQKDSRDRYEAVKSESVGKMMLLSMLDKHPEDSRMQYAIAASGQVDMDIYNKLIQLPPNTIKLQIYRTLIYNNNLADINIYKKLLDNQEMAEMIPAYSYPSIRKHLLEITSQKIK